MAVPKSKVSKKKRDSRRAQTFKVAIAGIVKCPQCHDMKLAHRVCKTCGYYNGKQVIEAAAKA